MARAGLTAVEADTLWWSETAWWQYRAQVIVYVNELPIAERMAFDRTVRASYESPLGRLWYEMMKATLDADAVRYVDKLLAQPD